MKWESDYLNHEITDFIISFTFSLFSLETYYPVDAPASRVLPLEKSIGTVPKNNINCSVLTIGESFFVRTSAGFSFPGIQVMHDMFLVSYSYSITLASALIDLSVGSWQVLRESQRSSESTQILNLTSALINERIERHNSFHSSIAIPAAMVSADPIERTGRFDFLDVHPNT